MPHMTAQIAPKTIGRFEVLRELGRGAQSVVYLCNDPHLQREVAIKTLHFSAPEQRDKQSLLAEARTVSKLRHPNIVPIFEAGEQDDDPYLVFEYVEGGNLSQLLRSKPLTPVRAAEITLAVLDALTEAHGQGIIHRDLKPSNILLDAKGTPRVMDFGIAVRVADQAAAQDQGLMGSPAYMSPEYVDRRTVNAKTDLYAVGLILLEMLTGKRLRQSEALLPLLARIMREPVQLPADLQLDERLAAIILKAVAHDPQLRFESALLMKQALTAYLDSGQTTDAAEGAEANQQSTLDFLLRRMRHKSDFPALSDSVSSINKLTDSDKESITKLSDTILKDFSLTNKILRLVNSAFYRQAGGGSISTVSRAVIVLGFDAIRNIAVTVLLFEHLQNKGNANLLKEAFLRANLSGLLARDISKNLLPRDAEEAFICALFQGLGRLLAQYYFPDEIEEVRKLLQQGNVVEEAAVRQVLGISFEELGIGIARTWGFPTTIVNSMRRIPPGTVAKPNSREESLRVVAGMSNELCGVIADAAPDERAKSMKKITDRYSRSLPIAGEQLQETLQNAFKELSQVAAILHVNLKQSAFARQLQAVSGEKGTPESAEAGAAEDYDSDIARTVLSDTLIGGDREAGEEAVAAGTPDDAHAILAAGIQDISNSLVENFSLHDVLRITLETMYRAMGFKRVMFCLRDPRAGQMTGRFGFGPSTSEIVPNFRFPLGIAPDVFRVATTKGVDIIIENINDEKIKDRIPAWYRKHVPAETFVLFPLMLKGAPVGLIYCDKDKAGEIVIPAKELSLLKTLRNQALLGIKQTA